VVVLFVKFGRHSSIKKEVRVSKMRTIHVTYTIKHNVTMEVEESDMEYWINIVGSTLAENGSCNYKDSIDREVTKTRIHYCASFAGKIE